MKGITLLFGVTHATMKAISAGADIVMINKEHKSKIRIINNLNKLGKKNSAALRRINESAARILNMKEKYNVNDSIIKNVDIEKINEEIDEINNIARGIKEN